MCCLHTVACEHSSALTPEKVGLGVNPDNFLVGAVPFARGCRVTPYGLTVAGRAERSICFFEALETGAKQTGGDTSTPDLRSLWLLLRYNSRALVRAHD